MSRLGWFTADGGISWPRMLLVVVAVVVLVGVGTAGAISLDAFNPYNPTWEGTSEFRGELVTGGDHEGEIMHSPGYEQLDGDGTVAFVVAPDSSYDATESAAVRDFVDRGGTLVVLDNFGGHGSALLEGVGAEARFNGSVVRDDRHYVAGPAMAVATEVSAHDYTIGVEQLTLNHGTVVEANGAEVLVSTSEFAYLGPELEEVDDESLRSYPVATVEAVGDGSVVAVGDPSIAINEMLDEPDNRAFLEALVADADRVVYDVSHSSDIPPLRLATLVVRGSPALQMVIGLVAVIGVAAAGRYRPWRSLRGRGDAVEPQGLSAAQARAYLEDRHPDWDDDHIERVITAFKRRGDESRSDSDE